ncbi:MAG: ABC transporter permease [Chloroflexia bacterium]|nr:ABC transporter permease [Chloroflexia bacterium]MDQ3411399.1 ABC transporter permease [Chloroflexota bacterium]
MTYLLENPERVWALTLVHIQLVGTSVAIAMLIGIPVGIIITRLRWLEAPVINTTGILYTIPSLALFAIMIPFTGIGATTVIIALAAYSLLAIVRNTVAGIDGVPPATLDAARGMGMTGGQRLVLVELPLALPVILAGIRLAAVAAVGIATIGAVVGAGGLGRLIFDGMRTLDADEILAGAIAASLLAIVIDWGLARLGDSLRRDASPAAGRG